MSTFSNIINLQLIVKHRSFQLSENPDTEADPMCLRQ